MMKEKIKEAHKIWIGFLAEVRKLMEAEFGRVTLEEVFMYLVYVGNNSDLPQPKEKHEKPKNPMYG